MEEVTGYTSVELIGSTLHSLAVTEDRELVKRLFIQAVGGTTKSSQLAIQNKTGDRVKLSLKVTPLIIDGKVIGIYCIFRFRP